MSAMVDASAVIATNIPVTTPKVGRPDTAEVSFSTQELSPPPSPSMRSRGDNPYTYVEGGS